MGTETQFYDYSEDPESSLKERIDLVANKRDIARNKVDIRRQIEERIERKLLQEELGVYHNLFDDSNNSSLSEFQR